MTSADALAAAEVVAERVLAPAATEVDRTGSLPPEHLDALARDGLYGIAAPAEHGGVDRATRYRVIEALAAGCLSTTLVWMQHHGVVSAVAASPLTGHVLGDLCSGSLRAGVAIGGIRPGVVPLRVRRVGTDLELTGIGMHGALGLR